MIPRRDAPTPLRRGGLLAGSRSIPGSSSLRFVDPDQFHGAIRGGDHLLSFLARGAFRGDVTTVGLNHVMLQRGRENLPRLSSSGMPPGRSDCSVGLATASCRSFVVRRCGEEIGCALAPACSRITGRLDPSTS